MRATTFLSEALSRALSGLGLALPERVSIEPPKDKKFGDLACNAAMLLTKEAKMPPRALAEKIAAALEESEADVAKADVAGPGFLNVTFTPGFWQRTVSDVRAANGEYGRSAMGAGRKVQVEFVSANPTGPLHIGHGRGAAIGDSVARILRFTGHDVTTEYYINDAGLQMRLLGASIFRRYQQLFDPDLPMLDEGYKGDYIIDHARVMQEKHGRALLDMPEEEAREICYQYGMDAIMAGIRKDMDDFRVHHDVFFSEKSLHAAGKVQEAFDFLTERGLIYEQEGALWFATTRFGDDKDRVLRKSSGALTYFAADIAYHLDKFRRGFDLVVDVWGADHHGYIPRMKAAVQAMGKDPEQLQVILVQLVNLLRGGQQVAMSTRSGEFEELSAVVREVGTDSSRFTFLSRKSDSKLDFDLELVKQQSMDNPVYYVQYAFARISSVGRKAAEEGIAIDAAGADLALLDTEADLDLLKCLERWPDIAEVAARTLSPHHVSYYLQELAGLLHRYYSVNKVLDAAAPALTGARFALLEAVAATIKSGLALLGVEAPERM
ncbi:Arginyl-tRNA synthetase [Desulfovibrio sp. X2]|uniref:arginine--tRNA ligase n=1 Tax=Desulfovibrio sp. X2 TaxID=941449 RepID=UPI000358C6D3|nr:arginine--tRNA ligase [Desulfovibrio sp. X2]EPR37519.1 Arginyl-tRNA synthetase [Desulfovibrio sp. X2]